MLLLLQDICFTCRSPPNGSLFGADQVFLGEAGGRTGSLTDGPESFREPCSRDSWERILFLHLVVGQIFNFFYIFLVNVPPPLMTVNPAAVEDLPGGFGSHWHWLSFLLLLHPGSYVPPVSSAVAGRRSQPFGGSGWIFA